MPAFEHPHDEARLIYMPSAEINIVKHVAAFIYDNLQ